MAYVYRHIRLDKNEPFYIGIGSDSNYKRAYSSANRNNYWKSIVNKHGYKIQIIIDEVSKSEAIEKEIEFISLYGRLDKKTGCLCNMTDGGEGLQGHLFTEESKIKMGNAQIGNQKYKLRTTPQEEINRKISAANSGKKRSQEFILNMKTKFSGANNPNYGKPMSNEQKDKIRQAHSCKKVVQMDLSGNIIKIWPSTKSVKYGGFDQGNVWKCCNNLVKTHKKYIWKYGK